MGNLKIILITGIALMGVLLASCSKNDDFYYLDIATVNPLERNTFYLTLDDGTTLLPSTAIPHYIPRDNQRAMVAYVLADDSLNGAYDQTIHINAIQNVLTKNPVLLTAANADSIGHDPVKIHQSWIGDGYLNIYFSFRHADGAPKHFINMVKNEEGGRENYYELRHNAYGDVTSQWLSYGYVSFNLASLRMQGATSTTFTLAFRPYDNEKTEEIKITYDWSQGNKAKKSSIIKVKSEDITEVW